MKTPGMAVPPEQRDSAWYIWNKLFMVRIPYLQSMSPDYIRHFGVPISGDPVRDKAISSEKITTMITIAKMVEYFHQGVTIGVVKHTDTKEIYEYISDHLQGWRKQLEVGLNNRNAPIEDLVLMDRFAQAVYRHAVQHFENEFVEGILARRMMSAMRVNRNNLFKRTPDTPAKTTSSEVEEDPMSKFPQRNSLAEAFASHRAVGRPRWK